MFAKKTKNYVVYDVVMSGVPTHYDILFSMLDSIDLSGKLLFVLSVRHVDYFTRCESKTLRLINAAKKIAQNNNLTFHLVFEELYEAPSYRYNLINYVNDISEQCHIPTTDMIIWAGGLHQFGDPVKYAVSYEMAGIGPLDVSKCDLDPYHHYISLAKIAKPHRIHSTVEMLDRGLKFNGYMSLGCGYYSDSSENNFDLVPERYRDLMPLVLDTELVGLTHDAEFSNEDERISRAFINVVQETSYDHGIHNGRWNLPFITEKTIKPFAWGQVPIFIAPRYTVKYIRELGYDVFDDLIDHSYDEESDGMWRINKAITQLEKICRMDMGSLIQYKRDNINRFYKNRKRLRTFDSRTLTIKNLIEVLT
jgi:hypothetical protein